MNADFMRKLKATLDALIAENKALKARLDAVEHSVNDVIIGGLQDAANEYEDNENFSVFVDDYASVYEPYAEVSKVLFGDDYDIAEELYAGSKGKEDVAAYINEEIAKYQAKADALRALKNGTSNEEEVVVTEVPVDDLSEEDYLAQLTAKYL